jgi:hypothetical protein
MSTADEIFRLTGSDEPHIVINHDRSVTVPSDLKNIAVQYDHNIETVTFDCPRYWDDTDMSEMLVSINYSLSNGFEDTYICPEVTIDETDDSIIHFTWTISNKVTQAIGSIEFVTCLKLLDETEIATRVWHSQTCKDLNVLPGKECDARIISEFEEGVRSVPNPLEYLTSLDALYSGIEFPPDYELTVNAPRAINYKSLLKNNETIKSVVLIGNDADNTLIFTDTFYGATALEIVNIEKLKANISSADNAFRNAGALKEIKGQINIRSLASGNNCFTGCYSLEEVRFTPNSFTASFGMPNSPLLSTESLQSIIDAMIPRLAGGSNTLYLHPDAASRLTEEQIIQITNKGWTVQ